VRRQARGEYSPNHGIREWNRKPGVWAAQDSSEVSQDIGLSAYFQTMAMADRHVLLLSRSRWSHQEQLGV
jgi:hypothetical protein